MAMATAMAIMGGISAGIVAIIMAGATTATAIATDAGDRRRLERVLILSGRVRTSPPRPLSRPEVLRPRDQSGLNAPPYKFRHANLLALRSGCELRSQVRINLRKQVVAIKLLSFAADHHERSVRRI
jgi:hypothetical protein